MNKGFVARASIVVNAPPAKVWTALTDPKLIKEYLFGTEAESDWRVGSPIRYRGVWQGKTYEDKGTVLENVKERRLVTTYWSSMGGLPDAPENYNTVTYELELMGAATRVTIIQDNNPTEESRAHSEQNWKLVLEALKRLLER